MRKKYAAARREFAAVSRTPCCARKIAKPIDGYNGCPVEGTYVKCRSHMRQMMLDRVEFSASFVPGEGLFQKTANVRARATVTDTAEHQIDGGPLCQKIYNLTQELGPVVLIE